MNALPPPPAEIAYLAKRIGAAATLKLIEQRGGTRVFIPRAPADGQVLVAQIGIEAVAALSEGWGGEYLKIPLVKWWRARVYRSQGLNHREIAQRLGCTENTVGTYLRGPGPAAGAPPVETAQMALKL